MNNNTFVCIAWIIISILILIIIISIFHNPKTIVRNSLITRKEINNYNEIAIVGNGPLTLKEMKEINKKDKVYRFNNAPKFRKGRDKLDGLFIREVGYKLWQCSHSDYFLEQNKDISFEKIYIGEFNSNFHKYPGCDFIGVHESLWQPNSPYQNKNLFPRCKYCKDTNNCYHKNSRVGPSSGILAIEYLMNKYPQTKLHIYGMNWSHLIGHLQNEKNIIKNCCPNCIIHKTHSLVHRL